LGKKWGRKRDTRRKITQHSIIHVKMLPRLPIPNSSASRGQDRVSGRKGFARVGALSNPAGKSEEAMGERGNKSPRGEMTEGTGRFCRKLFLSGGWDLLSPIDEIPRGGVFPSES